MYKDVLKNCMQPIYKRLLFVTGMSGAGKTAALKSLQGYGYDILDYAPPELIKISLQNDYFKGGSGKIAVGAGAATLGFTAEKFLTLTEEIKSCAESFTLLFLDCDNEVILRRYAETRLRHPLARFNDPAEAIRTERKNLENIRENADLTIDTGALSPQEFRRRLGELFARENSAAVHDKPLIIIRSFGFKYGSPRNADTVWDVRFLRNPYWDSDLRSLNGLDEKVIDYVEADTSFAEFWSKITDCSLFMLGAAGREGKQYYQIGIGCTGGRHRSVVIAQKLKEYFIFHGYDAIVRHANLDTGSIL